MVLLSLLLPFLEIMFISHFLMSVVLEYSYEKNDDEEIEFEKNKKLNAEES